MSGGFEKVTEKLGAEDSRVVIDERLSAGVSASTALLNLQNDISKAHSQIADVLWDATRKAQNSLATNPEYGLSAGGRIQDPGTLGKMFNNWLEFVSSASRASLAVAESLLKNVVRPMNDAVASVQAARVKFFGSKALATTAKADDTITGDPKALRQYMRAKAKVELATQEYENAVSARAELRERFKDRLKPELDAKAATRIECARVMLDEANYDLKEAAKQEGASLATALTTTDVSLQDLETRELKRLENVRISMGEFVRSFFEYYRTIGRSLLFFAESIETFNPEYELSKWAGKVSGDIAVPDSGTTDLVPILTIQEMGLLKKLTSPDEVEQPGAAEKMASMQNLVRTYENKIRELEQENRALREKMGMLQGGEEGELPQRKGKRISKASSVKGDTGGFESEEEASEPEFISPKPAVAVPKKKASERIRPLQLPVSPGSGREGSKGPMLSDRSDVSTLKSPPLSAVESTGSISGHGPPSQLEPSLERPPSGEEPQEESEVSKSVSREEEEFSITRYVHKLPKFFDVADDISPAERLVEIQRRFEEFLLCLRNLDFSDIIRTDSWMDDRYDKGLEIEAGMECYPFKLPGDSTYSMAANVSMPMALEWGHKSFSDYDWKLVAYETLLLCHYVMASKIRFRDTDILLEQDINKLCPRLPKPVNADHAKKNVDVQPVKPPDKARRRSLFVGDPSNMAAMMAAVEAAEGHHGDNVTESTPAAALHGGRRELNALEANVALLECNCALLRELTVEMRVKLKLSGVENSIITQLTIPQPMDDVQSINLHALDIRFRVLRLLSAWNQANTPLASGKTIKEDPVSTDWIRRQLHVLQVSILMKLNRLLKFIPQTSALFTWLCLWHDQPNWAIQIWKRITPFAAKDDAFFKGGLNSALELLKGCCFIIQDFQAALAENMWGVDVYEMNSAASTADSKKKDAKGPSLAASANPAVRLKAKMTGFKNAEAFTRLISFMTALASLDQGIRNKICEDEKGMMMGGAFARTNSIADRNKKQDVREPVKKETKASPVKIVSGELYPSPRRYPRIEDPVQTLSEFVLSFHTMKVHPFWQYEPLLQYFLTFLLSTACHSDPNAYLGAQASFWAPATMIVAHMFSGADPTSIDNPDLTQTVLSLDTFAILFAQSQWEEVLETAYRKKEKKLDSFDIDFNLDASPGPSKGSSTLTLPENLIIPSDAISAMTLVLTDFGKWLKSTAAPEQGDGTKDIEGNVPVLWRGPVQADVVVLIDDSEAPIPEARFVRLLECTPQDPWESLTKLRHMFRRRNSDEERVSLTEYSNPDYKPYTDNTDPDFFVVDISEEDLEPSPEPDLFYQPFEDIRETPEGLSVMYASRVERVCTELIFRRLITLKFRQQVRTALCDYRQFLNVDGIIPMLTLWDHLDDLLKLTPRFVPPANPELQQFIYGRLDESLHGPSARYDLYRYFISQSVKALFDRLTASALAPIRTGDEWFVTKISVLDEEDDPNVKADVERCWGETMKKLGESLHKFLKELRAEIIYYARVWAETLPGNQHALICMYVADAKLRHLLDEVRESPYWPEQDCPPYGAMILSIVSEFEKLVRAVKSGTRIELLEDVPSLREPFASCVANALTKRLWSVEELLARCITSETWAPVDPPEKLHSVAAVDFFSFVYHVLDAIWDFSAPLEWITPTVLTFLVRLSQDFSEFIRQDVMNPRLISIGLRAEVNFRHLTNPLARVDVSALGALMGKKKDKGKGFFSQFQLGGGSKKGKKPDLTHQLQAIQKKQMEDLNKPENLRAFMPGADMEGEEGEEYLKGITSGGETDESQSGDEDGEQKKAKKKRWRSTKSFITAAVGTGGGKKTQQQILEETDVTPELEELAQKVGLELAVKLFDVGKAFEGSPLPSFLVRVWNLNFYCQQLPELRNKIIKSSLDAVRARDPEYDAIVAALCKAAGRKPIEEKAADLDKAHQASLQGVRDHLQQVTEQCRGYVASKTREICRCIALRIVYIDLGADIFEDLYTPTFSPDSSLSLIVEAMGVTVFKFIQQAPAECQRDLLVDLFREIVKAWTTLITEMGYEGHSFSPSDVELLERDLDALKDFAARNMIDPEIDMVHVQQQQQRAGLFGRIVDRGKEAVSQNVAGEKLSPRTHKVDIFEYVGEFLANLASNPHLLAQLGGNYDPNAEKKKKEAAEKALESQPTTPIGENMFAAAAAAAPAFDDKAIAEITGQKKKKKGVAGFLHNVGL